MATTTAEPSGVPAGEEKGLKANAIGFVDALVIGLASTAPAYSLAAVIGSLVVVIGAQAPGALLASFVPMFFIATAFYYMNRADPDAGTTFSWVTRALGPWAGFMGGWAVCTTGILVVGSLADVGARYTYLLFGADGAAGSKVAVTALAVTYIVVLTWVCILGTELSARTQNVMILAQVGALLLFAVIALSTIVVALLAILWYVPANFISENFLFDTISALSLLIAFYYALSGLACVIYYRRELLRSDKNFVLIGVAPLIGAGLLAYLFFESVKLFTDPEESYTGSRSSASACPS